jgi:hypothetical protein
LVCTPLRGLHSLVILREPYSIAMID